MKGEEGRDRAQENASDKGKGAKQGRPWWRFWEGGEQ
jgi:hypothetical protein